MSLLHSARNYQDLLGSQDDSSAYEYAVLFKADGFWARQRAKKRFKLLKSIDSKLRRILMHGEKVYFITRGTSVTLGEQFLVGWAAYYLNMRALVFTSSRILLVQIDGRGRPRELISQLPYASIARVKSTWSGQCQITLLSRKSFNFQHIPRGDRKFLSEFLSDIVQLTNAPFEHKRGIEHLCPYCFTYVPHNPGKCPACGGSFKSVKQAAFRSLLLPGLGDWYLGHRGFAVLEIIGSVLLWFSLVLAPLFVPAAADAEPITREYWITAGIVLLVAHLIDGMMTHHFAKKGHHPARRPQSVNSQAPLAELPRPLNAGKKLEIRRTHPPTASTPTIEIQ